jgi:hypothetical protein
MTIFAINLFEDYFTRKKNRNKKDTQQKLIPFEVQCVVKKRDPFKQINPFTGVRSTLIKRKHFLIKKIFLFSN